MTAAEFRALGTAKARQGKNKFNAKRTVVDSVTYDSKAEAIWIQELKILERQGIIRDLETQKVFPLVVNGHHIAEYHADVVFFDVDAGRRRVQDCKGAKATPAFKLKARLMLALYGITVEIIQR